MAYYKVKKKVVPLPTIATWADGTDEEIAAMLEAHYNNQLNLYDYWTVGDERTVRLSAMDTYSTLTDTHVSQDVVFVLTEVGGKELVTPINGHTECVFQVDQKDCLLETGQMYTSSNMDANNNGWQPNIRHSWCNQIYYNALPSTLRPIFQRFKEYSSGGNSSSSTQINITNDYISFRASEEVLGSVPAYGVTGEGDYIEYYKTSANAQKKVNGTESDYWFRSKTMGNQYREGFHYLNRFVPSDSYAGGRQSKGLAPYGCI